MQISWLWLCLGRWAPICFALLFPNCLAGNASVLKANDTPRNDNLATTKVTVITEDTVLVPGIDYGRLDITASNITIDGQGVTLRGGNQAENERTGIAITSEGQKNVVLKNLSAHGWESGLSIRNASGWRVENCDFSDNFHDPQYGWGENGRRGGIVLENVTDSEIRHCKANRVWDACVLVDSDRNVLSNNDFSRTSNTCLKLWHSSKNIISDNNLSYGIRIRAGEVHARDSTGVLIESGSNGNHFQRNDCTHGGDGIFVRVLNGWVSTDNLFTENDCSFANNNGFECWAPRNSFISNKANHCSYGFWLGGSDQTRLIGNEASFNGQADGYHNSPHLPDNGHAGIVFMFGPSSHVLAYGNRCEGNEGAGIALIGDLQSKGEKWKAYHWVISANELRSNRWGIFAQHADWVTLFDNTYVTNTRSDLHIEENVSRLSTRSTTPIGTAASEEKTIIPDWYAGKRGRLSVAGPVSAQVGQQTHFQLDTADADFSKFEWDLGGKPANGIQVSRPFDTPGFYRIGVTASGATGIDLAYRDFYVVANAEEIAADTTKWSFEPERGLNCKFSDDSNNRLSGTSATHVLISPYHGNVARVLYPSTLDANITLEGKQTISFWIKANNPNLPGWQSNNPEVTLYQSNSRKLRIVPKRDMMQEQTNNEAREGWRYFSIPLNADPDWTHDGDTLNAINYFTIGFDSWGGDPLEIWIDGVVVE